MNLKMLFCDAETLSLEERAIILDVSFLFVNFNKRLDYTAEELVQEGVKFKFDSQEQKEKGRVIEQETLDFWMKQDASVRKRCVLPAEHDISLYDLPKHIDHYLKDQGIKTNKDFFFMSRGSLDEKLMFYLYKEIGFGTYNKFYHYNHHRDVRTALHFMVGAENGYIELGDEVQGLQKHDSLHDCVMDALMIQKALNMSL